MISPTLLDDLVQRIRAAIPQDARNLQEDIEKNVRAVLSSVFAKLDLVTREEFDVQTEVLARSRAKLQKLEEQVAHLEAELLKARGQ